MAHALEGQDGQYAFALRGEPAWHGLGTVFDKDADIHTADMLRLAHLADWGVAVEPVLVPEGYRVVSENYMVTRTNPFDAGKDVLAFVGKKYRPFQNEALFEFADNILDGGASWESAGSIKDGRVVFGSMVIPREFILDPQGANDKTVTYLLVHTAHDGSSSVQANITPVRVVCQNTLNMALNGSKQSFKIRHTSGTQSRVDEARRVLGLTFGHMDNFEVIARQLFEVEIDNKRFHEIISAVYPMPDSSAGKASLTKWESKVDLITDIYHQSPTMTNIKGTAWGALNAMTERIDYFRSARTNDGSALIGAASGFDPSTNAEKALILSAVKELAGI
jgi:phage/plasmid-like protein (TIGR03299 family)